MNEVYPGDTRYILDAFHIYEGHGEWFDLLHYPISREQFAYGGARTRFLYLGMSTKVYNRRNAVFHQPCPLPPVRGLL